MNHKIDRTIRHERDDMGALVRSHDPYCRMQEHGHKGECRGPRGEDARVGCGTPGKRSKAAWKAGGRAGSLKAFRRGAR